MSDKRQRARVQGSWAQQKPKAPKPGAVAVLSQQRATWAGAVQRNTSEDKSFEFQCPEPLRQIPPEKVLDSSGDYEISSEPSGSSRLRLIHHFLSTEEADWTFSKLLHELPWSQKTNYRLGGAYEEPRLTCWFGDLPYTYSNSTINANAEWPLELLSLRSRLLQSFGLTLNSVLCNFYRSGHDSIGWHSDDEPSLGERPTIASLSLGDTRVFSLRKKPAPENGDFTFSRHIKVPLSHGSLLIMEGATQDDWQHQVAKEYHDRGPRINLTFRTIHPEPPEPPGP